MTELESSANFPSEMDKFQQVLTRVDEYNAVRMKLTAEMAAAWSRSQPRQKPISLGGFGCDSRFHTFWAFVRWIGHLYTVRFLWGDVHRITTA